MTPNPLLPEGPSNTREAIMEATYEILRDQGYAALSMSKIADKLDMTKASLYYHFEGKDELLVEFLEFVLQRWGEDLSPEDQDDPHASLVALINTALPETLPDESTTNVTDTPISNALVQRAFSQTYIELRAQAAQDLEFRAQFTDNDRFFRRHLIRIIRNGIETGTFRDVNPDHVASLIQSTIEGTLLRRVTADDEESVGDARTELHEYIERRLLPEDD